MKRCTRKRSSGSGMQYVNVRKLTAALRTYLRRTERACSVEVVQQVDSKDPSRE